MRRHGAVASAYGLDAFPHLAVAYHDRSQFRARAAEYIVDAVQRNQRVEYAGDGSPAALRAELAAVPGAGDALASGQLSVTPVRDFYPFHPGSDVVDADAAVVRYVTATEHAVHDGYTGYRSVVDATAVASTPEQRAAFARCEYLVDRQMVMLPCSALCGYDAARLGGAAAELVCLHPFVEKGAVMFRCYAGSDSAVVLEGELDASVSELFTTTLQRVWPLTAGDTLRIDAADLEFIGHEQLLVLDRYARAAGRKVVLYTQQPIPLRVAGLLDLTNVRVEAPGELSAAAS